MAETAIESDVVKIDLTAGFHRIRSIAFSGGFFDGTSIALDDGLNCLIGNRGTGKTTVLEFVRYALGAFPDDPSLKHRVEGLVAQNLGGGRIELIIETKDGIEYTVSRTAGDPPIVYTADGEPTSISLHSGSVFGADIYSQNQVESIASDPASQLALLDGFITEAIAEIDRAIKDVLNDLNANALELGEHERQLGDTTERAGELPAVEEALRKFKEVNGGSSTAIDEAHAHKALRDREARACDATLDALREYHGELAGLTGRIEEQITRAFDDEALAGPNGKTIGRALAQIRLRAGAIDQSIAAALTEIGEAGGIIKDASAQLQQDHARQEAQFRQLIEKHKEAEQQSAERAKLERKCNELNALRKMQSEFTAKINMTRAQRDALLQRLSELRDTRFRRRQERAGAITEQLAPDIRVRVEQFGNRDAYCDLLETTLEGRSINRNVVAKKVADAIAPAELAEIVLSRSEQTLSDRAGINPNQAIAVIDAFSDRRRQFDLETVELIDQPTIELRDGDVYKDSLSLSTGQKCTAVLPMLMLDSSNPLLIDQPEDNLDNRFMVHAIVKRIRATKSRRQLVFVTHNPNIPVLGDAERVFVLSSDGRQARVADVGTVNDCREDIVTLLEGGREAFLERKDRYGY